MNPSALTSPAPTAHASGDAHVASLFSRAISGRTGKAIMWLFALAILLAGLHAAPVRRSQEARVLVTAREMYERGTLRGWLVPHMNLRVRLEKPPLAYWLSAASFWMFGVNDFAGRLPVAVAAWLTLCVTYVFAKRLFDARAALASAACLLGSFFFIRFGTVAETDGLAMFFVTAGIYFIWRFVDDDAPEHRLGRNNLIRAHASAIAIGLAVLAKGPPAAFVMIFLVLVCAFTRRWRRLGDWLLTGAPITAALIALPWFIYVWSLPEWSIIQTELGIALEGKEHTGPFYAYVPQILLAVAPWCGFFVLGLIASIVSARRDIRPRIVLCWMAAILVPLCIIGQKQAHYLVPVLPALAILSGWILSIADTNETLRKASRFIAPATACAIIACGIAVAITALHDRGHFVPIDYVLTGTMIAAGLIGLIGARRRSVFDNVMRMALGVIVGLFIYNSRWLPSIEGPSARDVAAEINRRRLREPFCYFGVAQSLPLAWELRTAIPRAVDESQLGDLEAKWPEGIVAVAQNKSDKPAPPPPPSGYVESLPPIICDDQTFHLYVQDR